MLGGSDKRLKEKGQKNKSEDEHQFRSPIHNQDIATESAVIRDR